MVTLQSVIDAGGLVVLKKLVQHEKKNIRKEVIANFDCSSTDVCMRSESQPTHQRSRNIPSPSHHSLAGQFQTSWLAIPRKSRHGACNLLPYHTS